MGLEEALPEDIEDGSIYLAVPHKRDLNLGRGLALQFVHETHPESYAKVASYFHQRGAYARFKGFLECKGTLEAWYEYEVQAVEHSLRAWSEENGLQLKP